MVLQKGVPIHKPSFYAKIMQETLADIFTSATHESIPMLKERAECLQEAGTVLIEVWGYHMNVSLYKFLQRDLVVL